MLHQTAWLQQKENGGTLQRSNFPIVDLFLLQGHINSSFLPFFPKSYKAFLIGMLLNVLTIVSIILYFRSWFNKLSASRIFEGNTYCNLDKNRYLFDGKFFAIYFFCNFKCFLGKFKSKLYPYLASWHKKLCLYKNVMLQSSAIDVLT